MKNGKSDAKKRAAGAKAKTKGTAAPVAKAAPRKVAGRTATTSKARAAAVTTAKSAGVKKAAAAKAPVAKTKKPAVAAKASPKAAPKAAAKPVAKAPVKASAKPKAPAKTGMKAAAKKIAGAAKTAVRKVQAAPAKAAKVAAKAKTKAKANPTYDKASLRKIAAAKKKWEQEELGKSLAKMPLRKPEYITDSGVPIPHLLGPVERAHEDYLRDIGFPGQFPFTRGPQSTMYRARHWTMRQFAGFGTPADTNKRFKYLLSQGMTGLSTAFDMPALMGYDADHPMSRGEVGKEGVAASSLADFEVLYQDIPLDKVTTSMTINASAIYALACYVVTGEKMGVPPEKLGGTIQADILKEYIAQKEWIVPPRPAVRIVIDMIEWCSKHMPRWNPISISGYHIREAGATAVQEAAFTLADGLGYVEECVKRGMNVDDFAPRPTRGR